MFPLSPILISSIPVQATPAPSPSHIRYNVLLLTFCITFMMYVDRAVMGSATPAIMRQFGLSKIGMGWSTSAFNWSYALFQVPGGWLADRFGPRLVLACALAWWSVFTSSTGLAYNAISLAVARFFFGVGEAAAFPSSSRALLRWLPVRQRAFGQGFQHAGSRFGAALAPLIVALLVARLNLNWQSVFFLLGIVGVIWAAVWYFYYRDDPREHAAVDSAEIALIGISPKLKARQSPVPWSRIPPQPRPLVPQRHVFLLRLGTLGLYLQWLPTYFTEARHFTNIKSWIFQSGAAASRVEGGEYPVGRAEITVGTVFIQESSSDRAVIVDGLRTGAAVRGIERRDGAARIAHEAVFGVLRIEVVPGSLTRRIDRINYCARVSVRRGVNRRHHTFGVANKSVVVAVRIDVITRHLARGVDC